MNTGFINGLLLAVVNGAICLTLPFLLSLALQGKKASIKQSQPIATEPDVNQDIYADLTLQELQP